MHDKERDCKSQRHETNVHEFAVLDSARWTRKLNRSTFTMSLQSVSVEKVMVSQVENGTVDR